MENLFIYFRFGWFSNQIFYSWGQTDFKNSFEFANQTRPRASRFITPRFVFHMYWFRLLENWFKLQIDLNWFILVHNWFKINSNFIQISFNFIQFSFNFHSNWSRIDSNWFNTYFFRFRFNPGRGQWGPEKEEKT